MLDSVNARKFDFGEHDVDAYGCGVSSFTEEVEDSPVLASMKEAIELLQRKDPGMSLE